MESDNNVSEFSSKPKKTCTCKHNSFNYDNYYKHDETELITVMEIAIDLAIPQHLHLLQSYL